MFLKSILCFGANLTPPGGQTRVMPELGYNGLYPKSDLQLNYEKKLKIPNQPQAAPKIPQTGVLAPSSPTPASDIFIIQNSLRSFYIRK